jgi:hypothetical protein
MISKALKFLSIASFIAAVGIFIVFAVWDTPIKQTPVEVEIPATK